MAQAETSAPPISSVEDLEERLSRPTAEVVQLFREWQGDLLVLGVAGKMGPTLARMARRAMDEAGNRAKVIGVARFSQPRVRERLEAAGVHTVACDLLDAEAVQSLPEAPNVVFMAGMKFGTTGAEPLTWAMNTVVPASVAHRFRQSRMVVFSTGNVYPLMPVTSGGATEETPPAPIGEYAQSALGRERVFQYFSARYGTPMVLFRLNYAVELRYGVILDVAQKVWRGEPVPLTMGCVNVIWQGDACAWALRCLPLAQSPPLILNATGPETVSVRSLAQRLGNLMGRQPRYEGEEAPNALLSNAGKAHRLFGYPLVAVDTVIEWTAHWVMRGLPTLDKPTHYEVRDGRF
ncbi:MAG: NAD-dependent epimerase/dehydratase family protein [Armatimonadota bacterium]|nr:NAD-dependent epimerase/dehydratase family protein [Armatimonadota bacterium]